MTTNRRPFGPLEKQAEMRLSGSSKSAWKREVKDLLMDKYPYLASGLQQVEFKQINEDEGNAAGHIQYVAGNLRMTIPIFIDNNDLKNPDIAIWKKRFIPINQKFIEWLQMDESNVGTLYEDDINAADFKSEDHVFDKEGSYDPAIKKQAIDLMESLNIPYRYKSMIKKSSDAIDEDEIVAINPVELPGYPYHYDVGVITKQANVYSYDIKQQMNQVELNKLSSETIAKSPEPFILSVGKKTAIKKIEKTCRAKVLFADGMKDAKIVKPDILFEEPKTDDVIVLPNMDGGWAYGNAYGTIPGDAKGRVGVDDSFYFYNLQRDGYSTGKYVIISDQTKTSSVYHILSKESIKTGAGLDKEYEVYLLHGINSPLKINVIMKQSVSEITKADNSKLRNIGLEVADNGYPTYLVPKRYKLYYPKDEHLDLENPKQNIRKNVEKTASEYGGTLSIDRKDWDQYDIDVNGFIHKGWNKTASLMLSNTLTGLSHTDISEYEMDYDYVIKEASAENEIKLSALDEVRDEFIKLGSFLLNEVPRTYVKEAGIQNLVENLVGISMSDKSSIGNVRDIISDILTVLHHVGQLLIMVRMTKIDVDEGVLSQSVKAMTDLVNELRGQNPK